MKYPPDAASVDRIDTLVKAFLATFEDLNVPTDVALSALGSTMFTLSIVLLSAGDDDNIRSEIRRFADRMTVLTQAPPEAVVKTAAFLADARDGEVRQ